MCIEDIRIGRRRHSPPVISAVADTALPGNARRVKIRVIIRQDWAVATTGAAVIFRTADGSNFPIARCGFGFPMCELTLESDGIVVQDELTVSGGGAVNYNVFQVLLDDQEHSPATVSTGKSSPPNR